ncbi:uncharacterized protein TNCV_638661 [Trichonephila clavipes]|nr:uncharacterized protein TNCV_638661 [Trichonephila clavipes]
MKTGTNFYTSSLFALRTAVNETTNKTPAELFLGRKIITPFSKLINVKEDAKYVGNNIERLFDEARRNMQKQHKYWEKHYNLRRRDVHIKVNDLVLLQTHFLSAAGKKQVGKFMPKFEGPYKVLEIKGNNLVIWKNGRNITVNIDQVRVYRPRQSDTISSDSPVETLYDEQEVSHGSNRSNQGQFKEHKKTSSQESEGCRSRQSNTTREIPRNKRKINSTASKDPTIKDQRYVGKDPDKDLIIRTGKDTLLNKGKGVKRSIPSSISSKISNLKDLIPLHQEYSPLQVHQSCLIAELLQLQVDPEWKLVDVITRPVRPERQREDTTNKRRKQSRQIKPIQEELAHTIYGAVYKKKTESMRTSTTSKSTAYLAAYSAEEASGSLQLTAVPLAQGSKPEDDMDVCKCIVPSRHGTTFNSRRAVSPLKRWRKGNRETKLPVRLINTTNERRLVQEHKAPMRVDREIENVSSELGNVRLKVALLG